jgi:hypothetical protein
VKTANSTVTSGTSATCKSWLTRVSMWDWVVSVGVVFGWCGRGGERRTDGSIDRVVGY